jgi:hypothetical protein
MPKNSVYPAPASSWSEFTLALSLELNGSNGVCTSIKDVELVVKKLIRSSALKLSIATIFHTLYRDSLQLLEEGYWEAVAEIGKLRCHVIKYESSDIFSKADICRKSNDTVEISLKSFPGREVNEAHL